MSFEERIQSTSDVAQQGGLNFLVHGPSGVGKTYMMRKLDGPALIGSCESGLKSLMDRDMDYLQIEQISDLREMYKYLAGGDHNYEWAALDSISEMAEICLSEQKAECKHGQAAYGNMYDIIGKLMRAFRDIDLNVYFSAKQMREEMPHGYLYAPSMPGNKFTSDRPISHDFDYVFALQIADEDTKDEEEPPRVLQTRRDSQYDAKVRDPYGVLDKYEEPDLGAIRQKIVNAGE